MKIVCTLIGVIAGCCLVSGQNTAIRFESVYGADVNGSYWNNAFYGSGSDLSIAFGDLNADGKIDLVKGSRYRVEWQKNIGSASAPAFEDLNRGNILKDSNMFYVPYLVDIDNDKDLDLFCGNLLGTISFFENDGTPQSPHFKAPVYNYANIKAGWNAKIAFCDIDNDQDFDLFIGDADGYLHFFKNVGTSAAPVFSEQPGSFVPVVTTRICPEFADLDRDGDFDLLVSNDFGQVRQYTNTGNARTANFQLTSSSYLGINLGYSSAVVRVADLNSDGDLDVYLSDLKGYFYEYQNKGSFTTPIWGMTTIMFDKILRFGRASAPSAADIDGDGDTDLVFGTGKILLNSGTPVKPSWTADLSLTGNFEFMFGQTTLVDIDGDQDFDLFYGDNNGPVRFYENRGSRTVPNWVATVTEYQGLNLGFNSHPSVCFADIDGDGDQDMFLQYLNSSDTRYPVNFDIMRFYRNTGTRTRAVWQIADPNFLKLGEKGIAFSRSYFADIDQDGDLDMIAGNARGTFFRFFINRGTAQSPDLVLDEGLTQYGSEGGAAYPSPILADLNGDHYPEIISGTDGGGINVFLNRTGPSDVETTVLSGWTVEVYPNPAQEFIQIQTNASEITSIDVLTVSGQKVLTFGKTGDAARIDISQLHPGVYFLRIKSGGGQSFPKFIKST